MLSTASPLPARIGGRTETSQQRQIRQDLATLEAGELLAEAFCGAASWGDT